MVKLNVGFGLVRDTEALDPELTTRTIAGLDLRVKTGFVCHPAQQSPHPSPTGLSIGTHLFGEG